jgi:hypothetical protein
MPKTGSQTSQIVTGGFTLDGVEGAALLRQNVEERPFMAA